MNHTQNKSLTGKAQALRKNMTDTERRLWYTFLKKLPYTVHRQKVIGNFIVDFYIAEARLVIELDGSQHYEQEHEKKDRERDKVLKELGFKVLRYTNIEVEQNFKRVCEDIWIRIQR